MTGEQIERQWTIEVADNPAFENSQFLIPMGGREATLARLLNLNQQSRNGTEHYRLVVRTVTTGAWEVVDR